MANDSMRSKAAAVFGKEFMNVVKGGNAGGTQVNGAQALQKRANARPIPTYKDGGMVSKAAVDQARVATRAKAAGYKDGGSPDKYKAKLDRKMADIEKDYQKALSKGKSDSIAKAKYEQRMADARDDFAKWTKADRTETKAAERASEAALSEARRTKGASIVKRDAPSVASEMAKSQAEPKSTGSAGDLAKAIKVETAAVRAAAKPAVKRVVASRSNGRAAAPQAERAQAPINKAPQAGGQQQIGISKGTAPQTPAVAPRTVRTAIGDQATALEQSAYRKRIAAAQPNTNEGRIARIADWFGLGASGDAARAKAIRSEAMNAAVRQAAADKAAANRPDRKTDYLRRAAAERAAGREGNAKFYEREAARLKKGGEVSKYAAGGAAKTRKGQAPIKKGR